jgi:hypothetical protein
MASRFHPEKLASQIVFDITGGEKQLKTMHLDTIPNRPHLVKSATESFTLRTDDIEGARYVRPKTVAHNPMKTSDIAGACSRPMVDDSKPAVDIMHAHDIDGSKPRIFRSLPHSSRVVNPVDPAYTLPSKAPDPVEVPRFVRDSMYNDDVEGAHPTSYHSAKPPRDIMRVDDIAGTSPTPKTRQRRRGVDTMDVRDINDDGLFKSRRTVDPLDPTYRFDRRDIRADDYGKVRPPPRPRDGPDRQMNIDDIEGTHADASTKRYRRFRRPPPPPEDDALKPPEILMVPSMKKQTRELEMHAAARKARAERIRYYENRNLHAEVGTGDPIQAILREQRNGQTGSRDGTFR